MTRSLPRRVAALALVVLIVSSTAAAPAAGSTAFGDDDVRQDWTTDYACGSVGGAAGALASTLGLVGVSGAVDAYCHAESAPEQTTSEVTKGTIYQDATELKSWSETTTTQTNNSLQNLQTTLYAYGEAEQNAVIENGTTSVSAVNTAVNQSINKRVAKMQMNQLAAWNQRVQSLRNLAVSRDTAGVPKLFIHYGWMGGYYVQPDDNFAWTNVTLANGTMEEMLIFQPQDPDYSGSLANGTNPTKMSVWSIMHPANGYINNVGAEAEQSEWNFIVKNASGSNDPVRLFSDGNSPTHAQNWKTLNDKAKLAKQNLAATASWKVDAYVAGEVDLANATSSLTLAQEYTTRYNETGNLAYARAAAASAGYAVPDLNNTSVMTVHDEEAGYNYTGQLFSQHAPDNGSWVVGQQYDASEIGGVQVVATTEGSMHELDGNFTVTSLKNANGESLNSTSIRQYDYQTSNASEYLELQQEINDLREEIANQTAGGGGGGPSGSGGGSGSIAVVGLLAVLAGGAVIYLQRDN